jgi:hypothetical protein
MTFLCLYEIANFIVLYQESFAAQLKEIWLAPSAKIARQRAEQISEQYGKRFPKAIELLQMGWKIL